jgi:hypothetical protein
MATKDSFSKLPLTLTPKYDFFLYIKWPEPLFLKPKRKAFPKIREGQRGLKTGDQKLRVMIKNNNHSRTPGRLRRPKRSLRWRRDRSPDKVGEANRWNRILNRSGYRSIPSTFSGDRQVGRFNRPLQENGDAVRGRSGLPD